MAFFKRKVYDELLAWKERSQGRTAILLEGPRRVGKTTLAREFGKREYESCLVIDFTSITPEIRTAFLDLIGQPDQFFLYLQAATGVHLVERNSLVIFDEVQMFPWARQSVKHLVADGRYDYLETGSLVSIKRNVKDILIPSEEHAISLEPMDFDEFLWAIGEGPMVEAIRHAFSALDSLPDFLHRKAQRLWREYLLVGGMPQSVAVFVSTGDFGEVDRVKREILSLYRTDIAKFAGGQEARVSRIFDAITTQLSKRNKTFSYSELGSNQRGREYEDAFFWMDEARFINRCYRVTDPSVGLRSSLDIDTFKCYFVDTGLLTSLAFADSSITEDGVLRDVLNGKLQTNEGMLVENLVAQSLKAAGHELFFWSWDDLDGTKKRYEVDFLITRGYENAAGRMRVSPVEVKSSSKHRSTKSLEVLKARKGRVLGTEYILAPRPMERLNADRIRLPLYMAGCL